MDKTAQGQNVPKTKRPQGQNVQGTKRSKGQNVPHLLPKFSKTHFVLENLPHILGNGPHPCNQFMIGVFQVWGG